MHSKHRPSRLIILARSPLRLSSLSLPVKLGRVRGRKIRSVESCVVSGIARKNLENDGAVALPEVTGWCSLGFVTSSDMFFTGGEVLPQNRSFKHLQGSQWLVERHLVARLVNSDKTIQPALSDLPMDNAIRAGDVDKSCLFISRSINFVGDNLTAQPVAVEIPESLN